MPNLERRKIVTAIASSLFITILPGCGGSKNQQDEDEGQTDPSTADSQEYLVYSDVADPRIISGYLDNEKYALSGLKSDDGAILSSNVIHFIPENAASSSISFSNEDKKITSLVDGVQVSLTRNDETNNITFGLVAGDNQVEVDIPISEIGERSVYFAPNQSRELTPIYLEMLPSSCCTSNKEPKQPVLYRDEGVAPLTTVNVSGCVGENPTIKVIMSDDTGKILDTIFGTKDPSGDFNILIPYRNTGTQALADASTNALEYLSDIGINDSFFSSLNNVLNPFSSVESTTTTVGNEFVKVLESRGELAENYSTFQSFLNLSDEAVNDFEKKAEFSKKLAKPLKGFLKAFDVFGKLSKAYGAGLVLGDFIDAYTQQTFNKIQLSPVVITSQGKSYTGTSSGLVSPEGPYPQLSVSVPGETKISSLSIIRSSDSYIAKGTVFCLTEGDSVSLSVSGTDDYTDQAVETVSFSESKDFKLTVPNGAGGIRDSIILKVLRNGATVVTRSTSLVF